MKLTGQRQAFPSTRVRDFVAAGIKQAYRGEDIPCVPASLRILGQLYGIEITGEVYAACWGLNGAGMYGAQCGLVEGPLMFLSLVCDRSHPMDTLEISRVCSNFAFDFEQKFGSLLCRELRPEGFSEDQPPHLCEKLSVDTITFAAEFVYDVFALPIAI